ncbi:hypothetical protein Sps_02688 [Shewanella psychrophila]|uniref:Uncharacterized protein n=1 Tax=Shewanella psychrophila TaxID=225848 RepID=A0A1S6HQN5_9GAMM|nr:hypothetical protein Sps_02688 [Shewanella psychrophila]
MSLLPCPSCNQKIVLEVKECPYCEKGDPFNKGDRTSLMMFFVWLLALLLTVNLLVVLFLASEVHHFFQW